MGDNDLDWADFHDIQTLTFQVHNQSVTFEVILCYGYDI